MSQKDKEWFGEWFDSPYYHILYGHRDHEEAQQFIDNLIDYFNIKPGHKVLDLACGKGRHSIYLNMKGFDVVGVDLSKKNIEYARQYENEHLHFHIHDMRQEFRAEEFDFVLNLFTSFGYFESERENQQSISAVARNLNEGGFFLLDFLNPYTVIHHLVPAETKLVDDIEFNIAKSINKYGYILKDIKFKVDDHLYHFQEKVKAIRRVEFLEYFKNAKLKLITMFGDYDLNPYKPESSERMIFIVKK